MADVGDAGWDSRASGIRRRRGDDDNGFARGLLGVERGRGVGEGRLSLRGTAGVGWERRCEGRAHGC